MEPQISDRDYVARSLGKVFDGLLSGSIKQTPLPGKLLYDKAVQSLVRHLPFAGIGLEQTMQHLTEEIVPGFNGLSLSPNYYGFVVGGSTPAASVADSLAIAYDQNTAIHMHGDTVATVVEDVALRQTLELLDLNPKDWSGRTMTTGATASNILGLACGREEIVHKALIKAARSSSVSAPCAPSEVGLLQACRIAGIKDFQIVTVMAHSSIYKAASILGLGRNCFKDVQDINNPWKIDLNRLAEALSADPTVASIVVVSCGEVNAGRYCTSGLVEMQRIRGLCDKFGAWLHVDGAFGLFTRMLDRSKFGCLRDGVEGMELADSLTVDGHKLLNVPYDSGFFFTKNLAVMEAVFQNPNAAYLATGSGRASVPSPLHIGIENSRRFRGLAVYSTLLSYGREGYRNMLERQIGLARAVANLIFRHPSFILLGHTDNELKEDAVINNILIIVLFRARDGALNSRLAADINSTNKMYVSSTSWQGETATRIAIANWRVEIDSDLRLVSEVLDAVSS